MICRTFDCSHLQHKNYSLGSKVKIIFPDLSTNISPMPEEQLSRAQMPRMTLCQAIAQGVFCRSTNANQDQFSPSHTTLMHQQITGLILSLLGTLQHLHCNFISIQQHLTDHAYTLSSIFNKMPRQCKPFCPQATHHVPLQRPSTTTRAATTLKIAQSQFR